MTIYEIKKRLGDKSNFFSKDTMRFFNQRMSDFKVRRAKEFPDHEVYHISAESYWDGKLMGVTERFYDVETNKLYFVKSVETVLDEMKVGK